MAADYTIYLWAFLATQGAFLALWLVSLRLTDSSVVDFWWGPGFLAQLLVAAWLDPEPLAPRGMLLVGLVGIWAIRLGVVLGRRRIAEGHEDPRYQALRAAWEPGYWWKSLFLVFVLQAVIQWVIALGPLAGLLAGTAELGPLALAGTVVALAGFGLEAKADAELDAFKRHAPPGALCQTGLRARVRYPNYLGEIVFWAGIALVVLDGGVWLGLLSPVLITLLLTRLSGAPMLDERLGETRPDYAEYKARVPGFIPRLG